MKKIAIGAIKGGVGKTTVTANLGMALSSLGYKVAFFDLDTDGPNLHTALGLEGNPSDLIDLDADAEKIIPYKEDRWQLFTLASIWGSGAFLWKGQDKIVKDTAGERTMKGTGRWALVEQLLDGIKWDDADFMLLDLPPSSAEVVQSLFRKLEGQIWGMVLVCQPTSLAKDDIVRTLDLLRHFRVPVLGLVENMNSFLAPDTGRRYPIFLSGHIDLRGFCRENKVAYLGEIPLCPEIDTLRPVYASVASAVVAAKPTPLWKRGIVHDVGLKVKVKAAKAAAKILAGGG